MALDSPYTLNAVRSLKNYGFYITGSTYDPIFTKGYVNSKPNILINGSTCTIDYSHVFDASDRTYFKKTFGSLGAGETFSISSSNYFDEENNILTTLSGTCKLSSSVNDDLIFISTILSGLTSTSSYNYYNKDNFVDVPQYTFTATGGTIGNFLVNSLPNASPTTLKDLGIFGSAFGFEEYISISGGTSSNIDKLQVYGTTTLKDGTEILYFTSGATAQDFSSTATTINHYLRGYPSLITAPYNSNVTGIFTITNASTGTLIYCLENQSLNQAQLRKSKLASGYLGSYMTCDSCFDLIYGNAAGTTINIVSPSFTNLIFLQILSGSTVFVSTALSASFLASSTTNVSLNYLTTNNILKIDLSHPSIIGYKLNIYLDAAYKIPVGDKYYSYGVEGYNGAYGILQNYPTSSTLYCVLSGLSNIYFTITT